MGLRRMYYSLIESINHLVKKKLFLRGAHIEKKLKPEFIKLVTAHSTKIKEYEIWYH